VGDGFVVLRRLGADFQFLGEQDWVSRLTQAQTFSTYQEGKKWRDEAQHGQVVTCEEAELIAQAQARGDDLGASLNWAASLAAARAAGAKVHHVTLTSARTNPTAPADSPRPAAGGEATEAGPLAGVAERVDDLAVDGGREHAFPAGAVGLAPTSAPCDPVSSTVGPVRPQAPPMSTGGAAIPSGPKCPICEGTIPDLQKRGPLPATCGAERCRKEHRRRQRFDRETRRRQQAQDGQQ
jgi:hypothetical protein